MLWSYKRHIYILQNFVVFKKLKICLIGSESIVSFSPCLLSLYIQNFICK